MTEAGFYRLQMILRFPLSASSWLQTFPAACLHLSWVPRGARPQGPQRW